MNKYINYLNDLVIYAQTSDNAIVRKCGRIASNVLENIANGARINAMEAYRQLRTNVIVAEEEAAYSAR